MLTSPDKVKEFLLSVQETEKDFTVVFTGKIHKKINGQYFFNDHTISINDRNFTHDSTLLYTAMHEYAHHIQFILRDKSGHNREFWTIFHNLVDTAIEKKLYTPPPRNEAIIEKEKEIKALLLERANIEKKIGSLSRELWEEVADAGGAIDYEIERELKEDMKLIKDVCLIAGIAPCGTEYNTEQSIIIGKKGTDAAIAIRDGKTLVQAQTAGKQIEKEDPYERLKKEKAQVVKKIERLKDRKDAIDFRMKQYELEFDKAEKEAIPDLNELNLGGL